jgi:4-carboxymuconolactone decarboxylase
MPKVLALKTCGDSKTANEKKALAALTALKCPQELKGHVRGALNNGCTVEEIREALLHCAVYAGVPAAIDAFRAAQEAIDTWQGEQPA